MRALLLSLLVGLPALVAAQTSVPPLTGSSPAAPSLALPEVPDSLVVSLLTMLPGDEVYSVFGHSALRIRNDARGLDRTYNYGTFDFDQPLFVLRFARGQLDYILDTAPFADELAKYQYLGRPMIEQRLDLSQNAAQALLRLLDENALPENRAYRYNFFFDNCSTRLLDMVDAAQREAGEPAVALAPITDSPTFRQMLAADTQGKPILGLGIDLGLGTPSDRVPNAREQTFLPVYLAAALDRATVGGRPLVASRDTLFWIPGADVVPRRTEPIIPTFVAILALLWLAAALRPVRFARLGRIADVILFGVTGVAGLAVAFMWFLTDHTVTGPNTNLLWAFPGHLGLAWAARRGALSLGWRRYAGVAAIGAMLALVLHVAGVQTLPVGGLLLAAVVAARAGWLAFRPPSAPTAGR